MPPTPPPQPIPTKSFSGRSWSAVARRANGIAGVVVLLITILAIGLAIGYFASQRKTAAPTKTPIQVQNLSPDEIKKLTDVSASLGNSGQTLNIATDTLFRGKMDVGGDLSVSGRFNANGPVTLSQLNITGTTALTGLNVGSNLNVTGATTMQKGLTVNQLLAVNGGLNVSGAASVNTLNASSISTRSLSISGPLAISHLVTQGLTPQATAGSGLGSGGTMNIGGNDTAGAFNLNTGGGTSGGLLAAVTFRAPYSATARVIITATNGNAAASNVYVIPTPSGFQVRSDSPLPAGSTFSFSYIAVQ